MKKIMLFAVALAGVILLSSTDQVLAGRSGVMLVSPTRQDRTYGPDISRALVKDSLVVENHHLFVYAVVDSESNSEIVNGPIVLHIRLRDVDTKTAGDQPGTWDDPGLRVNGRGLPVGLHRIGNSTWYNLEVVAIANATTHRDQYEITVTTGNDHTNRQAIDRSYDQDNVLVQGGKNHLHFVWNRNQR